MKVALVCSSYPPYIKGGGEISTQLLAEGLKAQGVDVVVIAASDLNSLEIINDVKVYRVKSPNIYWSHSSDAQPLFKKVIWHIFESVNFFARVRLLPILRKEKPDILHTSTIEDWSPSVWRAARRQGIKVVHTLRSYTLLCPRATMFKNGENCEKQCVSCRLATKPKKRFSNHVNQVIGISKYILNVHLESGYFGEAASHIIYNQVADNSSEFRHSDIKKGLSFGYIGRLHETKGVNKLLTLFSKSSIRHKNTLVIAGRGPEELEVKKYSDRYASIHFLGYTDPEQFFKKIDVLVVPSLWNEPFGRVIIESFKENVPVIASNVGGISELIDEGVNGYLFNVKDFDELLEAMVFLSENVDVVHSFRKNLRNYDSSVFDSDSVANEYIKVYSSC